MCAVTKATAWLAVDLSERCKCSTPRVVSNACSVLKDLVVIMALESNKQFCCGQTVKLFVVQPQSVVVGGFPLNDLEKMFGLKDDDLLLDQG